MFPLSPSLPARQSYLTLFLWLAVSSSSLWSTVHSEQEENEPFQCNICGPGLQIGTADALVSPDGRQNRTCGELQAFGDEGLISEEQCVELNSFVQDACDCQPFVCSICGMEGITTEPGGVLDIPFDEEGLTTCAAVQAVADLGGFNESFCDLVQSLALEPCGCRLMTDDENGEGGSGGGGNHSSPTRTPGGPPGGTSSAIPTPAPQESGSPPPPSASSTAVDARIGSSATSVLLCLLWTFYGE